MSNCDHDWGLTIGSTCPACEIERLEVELEQERSKRILMEQSLIAVSKLVSGFNMGKHETLPDPHSPARELEVLAAIADCYDKINEGK